MKAAAVFTFFLFFSASGICFTGKQGKKLPKRSLQLIFTHMIGKEPLVLGNACTNISGENMIVQKFKYYISNFSVTDNKGKIIRLPPKYFLVDEADSLSKIISLMVPDIAISKISFLLGVDSIRNVSGIQTGALDPLKGMFWTWNSGYIMAKLEGSSASSKIAGHSFTYHIGGFRQPMNTIRVISLDLPQNKKAKELCISADINQWFKSKSVLRITETPVCHDPGALAMKIADNYSTMFSLNSVH